MRNFDYSSLRLSAAVLLTCLISHAADSTLMLTTIARFNGTNGMGGWTLIQSSDGSFYGTSEAGGQYNLGTVFRLTPGGNLLAVASFDGTNGALPESGLIQDETGVLYGTALFGGTGVTGSVFSSHGTIYKTTTNGSFTILHSFNSTDGSGPIARLTRGSDGNLYGTTSKGGPYTNAHGLTLGTVFRVTTNGVFTNLAAFNGTNGAAPIAELIEGADDNFYGTTTRGGAADLGIVFRMTPSGDITALATFYGTNGSTPYAGLVQHRDGNFYGTTRFGGTSDNGTFFRMDTNGSLTTLASFDSTTGTRPRATLAIVDDSRFYGVTQLGGSPPSMQTALGTVFQVTTDGTITRLISFSLERGTQPFCTLVKSTNGLYYGTTDRTVFRLDNAIAPVIQSLTKTDNLVTLTWSSVPDQIYKLECSPNLNSPNWSEVPGAGVLVATSSNTTFEYSESEPQRVYRAVLRP